MKFLFNALKTSKEPISCELYERLQFRIQQRRNRDIVSLMKYLQNKDLLGTAELPTASKKVCTNLLLELFTKNFADDFNIENEINNAELSTYADDNDIVDRMERLPSPCTPDFDLNKQLKEAIQKETALSVSTTTLDKRQEMAKIIKHEITGFEKTFILGENMKKVLTALKTIQSTSTESERAFSLAANVVTKRRSRLSDRSVNNICFLRNYFLQKQQQ